MASANTKSTDIALLGLWVDGSREAGEMLFDRHVSRVNRFFRNKVASEQGELIQRTFLRCLELAKRGKSPQGGFPGFLVGVARNILYEYIRSVNRHSHVDFDSLSMADLSPRSASAILDQRREHRLLLEALRDLAVEKQVLLELYYWEDFTHAEIAEILAEPIGKVRARRRRAEIELRSKMEKLAASVAEYQSTVEGLERWARDLRLQLGTEHLHVV